MGKSPAFQFYVKDWLTDTNLMYVSKSTKGIWIDILCLMWLAPMKGELEFVSTQEFCKILSCTESEANTFFNEVKRYNFCYFSVTDNGYVTLRNRRMYSEQKSKSLNRLRQQRFREKRKGNSDVTPLSPSPSPKKEKKQKKEKEKFILPNWIQEDLWNDYMEVRQKIKCANTLRAKNMLVNKLIEFKDQGYDVTTLIETAIEKSWKSVYVTDKMKAGKTEHDEYSDIRNKVSKLQMKE